MGGGGLGPKSLCTNNGLARFLCFPTMVPWSGGGGGSRGRVAPLLLRCMAVLLLPLGGGGAMEVHCLRQRAPQRAPFRSAQA